MWNTEVKFNLLCSEIGPQNEIWFYDIWLPYGIWFPKKKITIQNSSKIYMKYYTREVFSYVGKEIVQ